MSKEFKLLLMIFLVLAAGYLSNKIIITGKFHVVEEVVNSEIFILSDPNKAEIYLGANYIGQTPLTLAALNPGDYKITLKKLGYYDLTKSVIINKNENKDVFFELEPNTGRAYVESDPSGADIYVDGLHAGITPKLVSGLSDGTHIIKITKEFYEDYHDFITVNKDRKEKVFFKLQGRAKPKMQEPLYSQKK